MKKKRTPSSEREIDDIVVAQADDDAAWGKFIRGGKVKATNVPLIRAACHASRFLRAPPSGEEY